MTAAVAASFLDEIQIPPERFLKSRQSEERHQESNPTDEPRVELHPDKSLKQMEEHGHRHHRPAHEVRSAGSWIINGAVEAAP